MAERPNASASASESGGGIGKKRNLLCIISCTDSAAETPAAKRYTNVDDLAAEKGIGSGVSFAKQYRELTGLSFLFIKVPTVNAGAIDARDVSGVSGTSAITFTGTPKDDFEIQIEVLTGGTIAAAGIEFRYSIDRGRTWSGRVRLGTAVTFAVPNTGVTANFAAGTLIADDLAKCYTRGPSTDAAGIGAAFDALVSIPDVPRVVLITDDLAAGATDLQAVIDEVTAFETTNGRHTHVFCSAADIYYPAKTQGTFTVTTSNAGKTYTRSAGSFITDGFKVGMIATWAGFVNSASNGAHTITVLSATVMTVSEAIGADEAAVAATVATAVETKSAWKDRVNVVVGLTPSTAKVSRKVTLFGGRGRRSEPGTRFARRRPASWWVAARYLAHDVHVSPAEVAAGALAGVAIHATDGITLEEYDERVDGGLLAMRVASLGTVDEYAGVYLSNDVCLDDDNAAMSRFPRSCVMDLACTIAKKETTRLLKSNVDLITDDGPTKGYPLPGEVIRIQESVLTQLQSNLLTNVAGEGKRASGITYEIDGAVDLRDVDAIVNGAGDLTFLGNIEAILSVISAK